MKTRFATAAGLGFALIVLPAASRGQELKGVAKRVADIFAEIDVNHDGVIDQSEIDGANKPAFKKLLAHGDANHDGKIDSKEFDTLGQKAVTTRKDAKKADKPAEAAKPEAAKPEMKPVVAKDDAPKAEMKPEVARPEKPEAAAGEKVGQLLQRFQAMDVDKDGKLTRDEFKGRPAVFDRLDTDHNGVIDKSDLKSLRAKQKAGEATKAKVDKVKKVKKAAAAV